MECRLFNWECAKEKVGPLFGGAIPWIKDYILSWTFFFIFISIIFIIWGHFLDKNTEILFLNISKDGIGEILVTIGSAIISGTVVKYLISGNFFAKAISNIIIEKFSSYEFIKDFNEKKVREIIKAINKAHPSISLNINEDELKKKKSIEKLEKYFKNLKESIVKKEKNGNKLTKHESFIKDKNYIVLESHDNRTVYQNGLEIVAKEYNIKILEEGNFLFKYKFQPKFSKNTSLSKGNFKTNNNRFSEYSYAINENFKAVNTYKKRQNYKTHYSLDMVTENNVEWFIISFTHKQCRIGDIINLEFSLSLPDEFRNEAINIIKKDETQSPKSTFSFPHAYRKFIFQKEVYSSKNDSALCKIEPTLNAYLDGSNNSQLDAVVRKTLFYKIYEWKLPYIDYDTKHITLTFE